MRMLHRAALIVLSIHVLVCRVEARGGKTALGAAGIKRSDEHFSLEGGAVDDDGDFEFDLDLSSKQKLKRKSQHSDEDEQEVVVAAVNGETTRAWKDQHDFTTKIAPSGMNYGRGTRYITTQSVEEGDVLFTVPFMEVMSMDTARQGRVKALLDANPTLPTSIALALHVLEERFRGESSRFYEYIQSMPSTMAMNSTMFYSQQDMDILRGSQLLRLTHGRIQGVATFYDALVGPVTSLAMDPPLFTTDQFTKENFDWAMGTVWARAFSLTGDESDAVVAPVLDTIGFCSEADCVQNHIEWDRQRQRLVAYATRDYSPGEEVRVAIDTTKASTLLMLNHGFARSQPHTAVETMDISIFLDPNDTLISVKSHLLESNNMSLNGSYSLRYKSDDLDRTLVQSLKLKLLAASELDKYHTLIAPASTDARVQAHSIVSLRNEYVFTRALVLSCQKLLAEYPTTLEHDRALRDDLEKHYRDRRDGVADKKLQIVRALLIEKEILQHTIDIALKQWTELLVMADPSALM